MRPGNFRDIFKLFLAVAVLLIVVFFFISFVVWALPLNGLADNYRMEKLSHIYNAVDIYAIITPFLSLREAKKKLDSNFNYFVPRYYCQPVNLLTIRSIRIIRAHTKKTSDPNDKELSRSRAFRLYGRRALYIKNVCGHWTCLLLIKLLNNFSIIIDFLANRRKSK